MITTLILFAIFSPSSSAPLTSSSEPLRRESSNNADTPDLRTIQGIVWSCIATIFACTWVAIHPNLPDPRISGWSRFRQRTGIVILAVFAPKFILIWALRQRIGAESIMKEYNRIILGIDKDQRSLVLQAREWFRVPSPPPCNGPLWTFVHGFYVQMGGFMLYDEEIAVRVLGFHELVELVQLGAVDRPNVTEEDICDRSKGDFLAKMLVVCQTTWFIVQCIVRWASGLPVTELEVMTLAFAILNIITYGLWWEKPQNVCIGVRVQLKEGEIKSWRGSNKNGREDSGREDVIHFHHSIDRTSGQDTDASFGKEEMDVTDSSRRESLQDVNTTVTWPGMEGMDIMIEGSSRTGDSQGADMLVAWPCIDGRDISDSGGNVRAFEDDFNPIATEHTMEEPDITGTDGMFLRPHPIVAHMNGNHDTRVPHPSPHAHDSIWARAAVLVKKSTRVLTKAVPHVKKSMRILTKAVPKPNPYGSIWARAAALAKKATRVLKWELYDELRLVVLGSLERGDEAVSASVPNLASGPLNVGTFYAYDTRIGQHLGLLIFAVACGTLFGGLHLIPWRFVFPTYSELLLWRIAALYITLSPIILSFPMLLMALYFSQPIRRRRRGWSTFSRLLPLLRAISQTVSFYILARILIVVLAFTTLRSLPPDAYKEIPWSSFIPHI